MDSRYSPEITYAYGRLGIAPGSSLAQIKTVLTNATAYRLWTKARIEQLTELVNFFAARAQLGPLEMPFAEIKKSYHRQAMNLHPDRNQSDKTAEDHLKALNAAYELVEKTHRDAKAYYKQHEKVRTEIEQEARQTTQREIPATDTRRTEAQTRPQPARAAPPRPAASASAPRKYMAAAIPRSIRTARLAYLPVQTIIGHKVTGKKNDISIIFDVIMLPEAQFVRAKSYLSNPDMASAHLQYGKSAHSYAPQDTRTVIVPANEPDPENYARAYFINAFGLTSSSQKP